MSNFTLQLSSSFIYLDLNTPQVRGLLKWLFRISLYVYSCCVAGRGYWSQTRSGLFQVTFVKLRQERVDSASARSSLKLLLV